MTHVPGPYHSLYYRTSKLIGLFVSPMEQTEDEGKLHPYSGRSDLALGLLNLNLTLAENPDNGIPIIRQYQGLSCTISPRDLIEEGGVYAKL